jgi:uncharacterized protein (TIGR02099 family)
VKYILKKVWYTFAIVLIITAVLSSLIRGLTPWLGQYKQQFESTLSKLSGHTVKIQAIESGWHWFQPVVRIKHLSIDESSKHTLKIKELMVGVNLFESLINWQLQPGELIVDGVTLDLNQTKSGFSLEGFNSIGNQILKHKPKNERDTNKTNLIEKKYTDWLLKQERFKLHNINLKIKLANGTLLPIHDLSLDLTNKGDKHKLEGKAELSQLTPTKIEFKGILHTNNKNIFHSDGEIYLASKDIVLPQWLNLIKHKRLNMDSGTARLKIWLGLKNGKPVDLQALVKLHNADFIKTGANKQNRLMVQQFKGNLSWQKTKKGWLFAGDNIQARIFGKTIKNNAVSINYDRKNKTLSHYIKELDLSLLDDVVNFIKDDYKKELEQIDPKGQLYDTRLVVTQGVPSAFLTRFKELSFNQFKSYPGSRNLNGAIYWQANQGHIEINSNDVTLLYDNHEVNLNLLGAQLNWKKLSHGWRIIAQRLVLQDKHTTLSSQLMIDGIDKGAFDNINLNADFSSHDLQYLKRYIPYKKLKPKLRQWIQTGIVKIGKAAGNIKLKGALKDFPFDGNNGEFRIDAHLSDSSLYFLPKWPKATNFDGNITLNGRTLEAQVHSGKLNDEIKVEKMNLKVSDIGLGKETLLLHGEIDTDSRLAKMYVFSSPLKKPLYGLQEIDLSGDLNLDLNLEIPLYKENDNNIIQGKITLKDNMADIHRWGDFKVSKLNGELYFDVDGISKSALTAESDGYPMEISIKNLTKPKKSTEVIINSKSSIDALKKKFDVPVFNAMQGEFSAKSHIVLTEDPDDYDSLNIITDLRGVRISLPKPFSKKAGQKRKLKLKFKIGMKKGVLAYVNYNNELSGAVKFNPLKKDMPIEAAEIRIGSGTALLPRGNNLRVLGTLEDFELKDWLGISHLAQANKSYSLLDKLTFADLYFKKAQIAGMQYTNLNVKATKGKHGWDIHLLNDDIQGRLMLNNQNTLSLDAVLDYWHIKSSNGTLPSASFTPQSLPPIKLKIAKLSVDNHTLGTLNLSSKVKRNRLLIDNLRIKSNKYELRLNGEWSQHNGKDKSMIRGYVVTRNLAGMLEHFEFNPVIEARYGELLYELKWNKPLHDISLEELNGDVSLTLKNGRITHLDKATEEKIGFGKLLSILSLQTIPRRLVLDFSDLSKSGFSYDMFKGSFKLNQGVMSTKDTYIDGPVAYASMNGQLNLVSKNYDLILKVAPHITASLPVVATIAGGPVAGIATWVASKIINHSMKKVSAYTYKVSGPWDSPVVQQLSITHAQRQ